jgi:hypothetical protein
MSFDLEKYSGRVSKTMLKTHSKRNPRLGTYRRRFPPMSDFLHAHVATSLWDQFMVLGGCVGGCALLILLLKPAIDRCWEMFFK